jgi:hypothetical protein
VEKLQSSFQSGVQSVLGRNLGRRVDIRLEEWLGCFDEDITEIVEEERIGSG